MNDQALILHLKVSQEWSDDSERDVFLSLEDELIETLSKIDVGEFDGIEDGEGYFRMFIYGANIDEVESVLLNVLKRFPIPTGSHYVKRYGPPGSREERIAL